MLTHYLHSAWRTIRRNPLYSLINIGCLAIGIAVCMTILLYVLHEHSFDKWQANARRIFSITATVNFGDANVNTPLVSDATAPIIAKSDSHVESWLRVYVSPVVSVEVPAKPEEFFAKEDHFLFADSNFFRMFSYRLLKGNRAEVLRRPYTVVLTESMAKKYFGDKDPLGQVLRVKGQFDLEVTGVAADLPSNTNMHFHFLASFASLSTMKGYKEALGSQTVQAGSFRTWLLLKDEHSAAGVERTLDRLAIVPGQPETQRDKYTLTALADYHLDGLFGDWSNLRYLSIFPLAAGLILLLAMVNYMSLATARAGARAREVGVRKVVGAGRGRIAGQFYTESAVFAVVSFAAGALLFLLFRSSFFRWLQLPIDVGFLLSPEMLAFSGGLLLLVIGTAGSYPALVLSAFRPVAVLYGKMSRQRGSERVRKGFIVLQFTISMTLVLSSVIIEKELYYIRHTDTGMDRENVIMIPFGNKLLHYAAFKHDIERLPGIRAVTTSQYAMYKGYDSWAVRVPGSSKTVEMHTVNVDNDFIPMLGLQWKERPGQEADIYDGRHLLLNETAADKSGLSGDPVGQRLRIGGEEMTIAGVLKDFNYQSLQYSIGSLILFVSKDTSSLWGNGMDGCMLAKIAPHANIPTVVEAIRKVYRQYDKQGDFEYSFADEAFDSQYKAEDRLAGLLGLFTVITIVIACLGLFALATFSAQQRVKEIGIRKVLGASAGSIGVLLSRDFLRPVLLAVFIACPLSWWLMNRWLQDFTYRTPLSWWIFLVAGLGLLGIALVTVLTRTLKAGRVNPVENLRTE
jgi:putative ABC transport system permease protein